MEANKRRFTRVPFKAETRIETAHSSYQVNGLYNLGLGGCLLSLDEEFDVGELCSVTILLSDADDDVNVRVDGEIVRSERGIVAVKFIRIEPESLFHLRNIIRYNAPDTDAIENEIEKHPGIV